MGVTMIPEANARPNNASYTYLNNVIQQPRDGIEHMPEVSFRFRPHMRTMISNPA
jgi:hypothetical protein